MGSLTATPAALLFPCLLALLWEVSSVLGQDLRETDTLCKANGCFMVYFQRKTFLDAWRACKEKGGNLATIKHREDAAMVAELFSTLDLRYSRTKVRVWIGLQRQPRQCSTTHLLRGFSWTTGDRDTEYTNWQKEDSQTKCSVPRCVGMGYSTQDSTESLKWLDGPCSLPADGYLCRYTYKGMCPALWSEGVGNVLYTTPFDLQSTLLTHVPFGSVASVSCPAGTEESVLCTLKYDDSVGWLSHSPLCSTPAALQDWCIQNNGGCEHVCRMDGAHFYCECHQGFQLKQDGQSCGFLDVCLGAPCESECLPLSDGYRCACPEGFMLAPDEHSCIDVDECLQSPCEQLCVNTPGTFECRCLEGYHPNDQGVCEDKDECLSYPCEHACENTPGSYICHCDLGFSPVPEDPSRCLDIDECQIPGTCEQMCVNYEGRFDCHCELGYVLLSDHYSCRKSDKADDQSAVTHQPGALWDPMDYEWNLQQSRTQWHSEEDQLVDWLTDAPTFVNSDVIWVTSASQDPPTRGTPRGEESIDTTAADWQISQTEPEALDNPVSTTRSGTTSDLYEGGEETTTDVSVISTTAVSGGAWNWWSDLSNKKEDKPAVDLNMPTDYSNREGDVTVKDLGDEENITRPQFPAILTQLTPSSPPCEAGEGGDIIDSIQADRGQSQTTTWLLVGVLVPVCIITVVMMALGIVYCTHCTVQPRSKSDSDCYHWISGSQDKGRAANAARFKNHV